MGSVLAGSSSVKRCPQCGQDRPLDDFPSSPRNRLGVYGYCKTCHSANVRRYAANNRAKVDTRVAAWLTAHPERWRAIHNRYNHRLREQVLTAYGHACTCCGISESEFLTFDHIAGDGAIRRRQGEPVGASLYQMLKREEFPRTVVQLLCHSCNKAKAFYGQCPHQSPSVKQQRGKFGAWAQRMRDRVIDGYGGRCTCCGESERAFLAIDHIYNDGAAERARLKMTSGQWYRWLVSMGCPRDRYRLLCHCCNEARAYYGHCPHEVRACSRPWAVGL